MKGFMGKIFNSIGFEYEEEDEEVEEVVETTTQPRSVSSITQSFADYKKSKIVDINSTQPQVIIAVVKKFDDVKIIAKHLKNNKTVLVNIENIDEADCLRVIDFLGGVTFALEGKVKPISNGILLATPDAVRVVEESNQETSSGSFKPYDWGKDY